MFLFLLHWEPEPEPGFCIGNETSLVAGEQNFAPQYKVHKQIRAICHVFFYSTYTSVFETANFENIRTTNRVVVRTLTFFGFSTKDTSCPVRHVIFSAKSSRGLSSGPKLGLPRLRYFNNIQYTGGGPRSTSDIPHLDFDPKNSSLRKSMIMTNAKEYSICPSDFSPISSISPVNYAIAEARINHYELFIEKRIITTDTCKAVPKINKVIRDLNKITLYRLINLPPEFQWSANIQQVTAATN
jgi:hypothetical protein